MYTNHYSKEVNLKMEFHKKKKLGNKPVINYKSKEGWENYERISDKHAPRIIEATRTEKDYNAMQAKIDEIKLDIELEEFGITYKKQSQGKQGKNRPKKTI